ncbi:Rieske 2Fe-2S domain-containing protein [Mucilaginibacter sp.]|uniref:Rieske (2Fe-2S) protein n=1 Tax=Mucilaginibacter sp. TaxID=1882438 RepID=UPI002621E827|nr:Rieske 2Fe-2S domain-containing protein [Mucilaginibacter sp.]MDB5029818.1 Rieske 2Fe-2S protein [Mucilaginibacter sp.]
MTWYKVPDIQYTKNPFIKKVKVNGKGICLVGYEGEIYALAAICPHAGGELSGGWCKDGKLICPIHRYAYDIHTGKGDPGQNDYVDTYPVEIREDGIYIGITSFLEKVRNAFK